MVVMLACPRRETLPEEKQESPANLSCNTLRTAPEDQEDGQADEALIETFRVRVIRPWNAQHGISEGPAEDPRAALLARLDTIAARHRARWMAGAPPEPEEGRKALI